MWRIPIRICKCQRSISPLVFIILMTSVSLSHETGRYAFIVTLNSTFTDIVLHPKDIGFSCFSPIFLCSLKGIPIFSQIIILVSHFFSLLYLVSTSGKYEHMPLNIWQPHYPIVYHYPIAQITMSLTVYTGLTLEWQYLKGLWSFRT